MAENPKKNPPVLTIRCPEFGFCVVAMAFLIALPSVVSGQIAGGSLADRLRNAAQNNRPEASDPASKPASATSAASQRSEQSDVGSTATFGGSPFDLALLGPLFAAPQSIAETESGPVLSREAEKSFLAGDQNTALRLMFGHMVAEYDDAQAELRGVKFSRLLKRPVWSVRFGVSMWVRDGGIGDKDPMPIPKQGQAGGVVAAGNQPTPGNSLRDAFRRLGGSRSNDLRASDSNRPTGPGSNTASEAADAGKNSDTPEAPPAAQLPTLTKGKMLSDQAATELDEKLGLVAEVVGQELQTRYQRGDFGPLLTNVTVAEDEAQAKTTSQTADNQPNPFGQLRPFGRPQAEPKASDSEMKSAEALTSSDSLPMWKPGIVYVGDGTTKEMIDRAHQADIDLLIHFEVVLKSGRGETVQNISRCRLINVATGKSIGTSKPMDTFEEKQLAPKGTGGRAYVEDRIENLLSIIDRDVVIVDLPALTPELVRRRLGSLLDNTPPRSLRTLAEIRLYQLLELLTTEEVELAFEMVGGSDSLLFLYGSDEQRAALARQWATKTESSTKQGS